MILLPDELAEITFCKNEDESVQIIFRYRTPSWRSYGRDLLINNDQVKELIEFLNKTYRELVNANN